MQISDVASLDLVAVHADGTRSPVAFRIGAPEQLSVEEWRCSMRLDGLHDDLESMHGSDSMQALCLALRLAAILLKGFVANGGRLRYTEMGTGSADEAEWPIEAYFGWLDVDRPPPLGEEA